MNEEQIRKMCSDIYEGESWQPMIDLIQSKDKEIKRLHSIIKEVREYIYRNSFDEEKKEIIDELWVNEIKDILEILDKENI